MTFSTSSTNRLLNILLTLEQYPILAQRIRGRMRDELFESGIIEPQDFNAEVRKMAIRSQKREGLRDPFSEEPAHVWDLRLAHFVDYLTDLIYSQHLSFEEFENIVNDVRNERGLVERELILSMNPELAPIDMIFEQAMTIERLPSTERSRYEPRLHECKVVLIRSLISDQLPYVNIAKEWFTISDLITISQRKVGSGRIGGKAAGMLLADRILNEVADDELKSCLRMPESYYIGSDMFYTFMSINNLLHWIDQKYKSEEDMRADFPVIVSDFEAGEFPPGIHEKLKSLLADVSSRPLIVRSSSQLEDNFGTSFVGKYESIFLPNQGTLQKNLKELTRAIARIYASTLNSDALLYRRSRGLQDYDERMAVLIQVVEGESFGRYYLPHAAGVAFSRNLYRWTPQIHREDGFVRLVWGMGTRAVDRVADDYPRIIALSHPLLRPTDSSDMISRSSQKYVDLIDLKSNQFKTLPIHEVLSSKYLPLRYLAQIEEDGYFSSIRSNMSVRQDSLVLTFDGLLRRTPFAERIRAILRWLERHYRLPVDVEFTLHLSQLESGKPHLSITILQCRPQSCLIPSVQVPLPIGLKEEEIIFSTTFMVPQGHIDRVNFVLFIPPESYFSLSTLNRRHELGRAVGQANSALTKEPFICVGPGRWGSSNPDLGIPIRYSEIYNVKALVELSGKGIGPDPEPSLGTHFFQDLIEAQIYPLAVVLDDPETVFNHEFFYHTSNHLSEWIKVDKNITDSLRLIRVADYLPGHHLKIIMSDEKCKAIAFMAAD